MPQRFGFIPKLLTQENLIWIHAVSVGEVIATQTIVDKIKKHYPDHQLVMSTGTPTGAATVARLYGETVIHVYQPYDIPFAVELFLRRMQPKILLVMETELWPNLFHYCRKISVPVVLVNARLSQRSAKRYARIPSITKSLLQDANTIAAQTDADAQRLMAMGAEQHKVLVTGSVKFDISVNEALRKKALQLKIDLFAGRPVWIAASTHEGEESMVLQVHQALLQHYPDSLLILAPRHPVRSSEIRQLLDRLSVEYATRSTMDLELDDKAVLLLDTMGELLLFYGVADIAFVAGSLVPNGGHNPIEPACFARPILIGPYDFNFKQIGQQLIEQGAALRISNEQQFAEVLIELFKNVDKSSLMGQKANNFIQANRGASAKVLNILQGYLD